MNRVNAVLDAMAYCVSWNYPHQILELTQDEMTALFKEEHPAWGALSVRSSTYIRIWGVDVKQEKYPRQSHIRSKYLDLIDPVPWIRILLEKIEGYVGDENE